MWLHRFHDRDHAFTVIATWLERYDQERPHSALGYLTLGGRLKTGQWLTAEKRPMGCGPDGFVALYAADPSVRKSVPVLVRQLRGPHLRMWA